MRCFQSILTSKSEAEDLATKAKGSIRFSLFSLLGLRLDFCLRSAPIAPDLEPVLKLSAGDDEAKGNSGGAGQTVLEV